MIPLDKRYVSTEFFDSREHPRFGTWVGLGDLGHEDVGREIVRTPGRGTYRLQDTINKQHLIFFC